jgi:chemotaxis protein CheC
MTLEDEDILRELSNIGAGHATTSLSRMLGRRHVGLSVPRLELSKTERILEIVGGADPRLVGVRLEVEGPLRGFVLVLLPQSSARALAAMVTERAEGALDELARSALMELGNVLTSSYLNALARIVRARLMPSPPTLCEGSAREVVGGVAALATAQHGGDEALVVVNEFAVEEERYLGYFLLFPEPASLRECLSAARGG